MHSERREAIKDLAPAKARGCRHREEYTLDAMISDEQWQIFGPMYANAVDMTALQGSLVVDESDGLECGTAQQNRGELRPGLAGTVDDHPLGCRSIAIEVQSRSDDEPASCRIEHGEC